MMKNSLLVTHHLIQKIRDFILLLIIVEPKAGRTSSIQKSNKVNGVRLKTLETSIQKKMNFSLII
jgi:hypothetical protein